MGSKPDTEGLETMNYLSFFTVQATVKHEDQVETYIGLTATTFKSRWAGHKTSFKHQKHQNSTTLSQYIWKLKNEQKTFTLTWKFVSRAPHSPQFQELVNYALERSTS